MTEDGSAPLASIVIVAWGRRAVTEVCLESLDRALGSEIGRGFELVLVDNGSPDDTAALFDSWRDRALVVSLPRNLFFAGGCNAGARAATGRALIFLNNDVEAAPGVLRGLAEQALEPGVGSAGCRLLYRDGALQHAGVAMRANRDGFVMPHHLFHREAGDHPLARATLDLDAVTAACLAMPRDLFHELGGFDEGYVNGHEDVDLCLRVRTAGRRVVYRGDLALLHDEGATRGESLGDDRNARRFHTRWGDLLDEDRELLAGAFDAAFPPRLTEVAGTLDPTGTGLVVSAQIGGLGPGAAEGRALLAACAAAGFAPAARNLVPPLVAPRLDPSEWDGLGDAIRRAIRPGALVIQVPQGPGCPTTLQPGAALRLAHVPSQPFPPTATAWAASPAVADALVAHGIAAQRVVYVPPVIAAGDVGAGGAGVLVVLPTHDPPSCEDVISALSRLGGLPVRLLPTVSTTAVDRRLRELLPSAEVLGPCSDERGFAALARESDAVLCADSSDAFDRWPLVAAASGAPALTVRPGPAAAVLGDGVVTDARSLVATVGSAVEDRTGRSERAAAVRAACGVAASAGRLPTLLDALERGRAQAGVRPASAA